MNKYEFFLNELVEMTNDRIDHELVEHYTWMSECAKFRDAADCGMVINKDVIHTEVTVINIFSDCDEFDTQAAIRSANHSTKARHRKHREARRISKVKCRKHSHWRHYYDGTAKKCKTNNHKAVRREYDIPVGKSNFSHKVGSYLYFY